MTSDGSALVQSNWIGLLSISSLWGGNGKMRKHIFTAVLIASLFFPVVSQADPLPPGFPPNGGVVDWKGQTWWADPDNGRAHTHSNGEFVIDGYSYSGSGRGVGSASIGLAPDVNWVEVSFIAPDLDVHAGIELGSFNQTGPSASHIRTWSMGTVEPRWDLSTSSPPSSTDAWNTREADLTHTWDPNDIFDNGSLVGFDTATPFEQRTQGQVGQIVVIGIGRRGDGSIDYYYNGSHVRHSTAVLADRFGYLSLYGGWWTKEVTFLDLQISNDYQPNFPPSGDDTVPEPASMILFGSAMAGLAAWRQRRKSL